jgi:hypothetical protein
MYDEPLIASKTLNLVIWLAMIAAVLLAAGLVLRWKSRLNVMARLNVLCGPPLFAVAWLYGAIFEPGANFGAIISDGFWGYWFHLRDKYSISGHYGVIVVLAALGVALFLILVIRFWRSRSQAHGTFGPSVALVFWVLGAIVVYYIPWCAADILTHYTAFDQGVDDFGELLSVMAREGMHLAAILAFSAMAIAWKLTANSQRTVAGTSAAEAALPAAN